jgi:MoaA/NifB/PqqE/SkfB family radical SAM enzyme
MTESSTLQILYRGPLESCNYGCRYCPFAKQRESAEAVRRDRAALSRFIGWCTALPEQDGQADRRLELLLTPWGEALHRKRYQRAMVALAGLRHVDTVCIQTNLSAVPQLLGSVPSPDRQKLSLWATWHPTETTLHSFVTRVQRTASMGITVSPGVVAIRDHLDQIDELAAALQSVGQRLAWINAYKVGYRTPKQYYTAQDLARLSAHDPWFLADLNGERSLGKVCETGTDAIAIDGDGEVTRCHFVKRVMGNIYQHQLNDILFPSCRPCSRTECNCFQGYVHLVDTDVHHTIGSSRERLTRAYVSASGA